MDKFEILNIIGEGAYGVVFRAKSRSTGELVAVKKFKDSKKDGECNTQRELTMLMKLHRHPHIVGLRESFRVSGALHLVFELMDHCVLDILERNEHGLPQQRVQSYVLQLLQAVSFCHENDVIHRDIKPENLLVSKNEATLKLCDFGFARPVRSDAADDDYTDYVATRWYRAPELLIGGVYGRGVDIWAVGCIYAELTDGKALFAGTSEYDMIFCIQMLLGELPKMHRDAFKTAPHFKGMKFPVVRNPSSLDERFDDKLSTDAYQFLEGALHVDPEKRLTAEQCLDEPVFLAEKRKAERMSQAGSARSRRTEQGLTAPHQDVQKMPSQPQKMQQPRLLSQRLPPPPIGQQRFPGQRMPPMGQRFPGQRPPRFSGPPGRFPGPPRMLPPGSRFPAPRAPYNASTAGMNRPKNVDTPVKLTDEKTKALPKSSKAQNSLKQKAQPVDTTQAVDTTVVTTQPVPDPAGTKSKWMKLKPKAAENLDPLDPSFLDNLIIQLENENDPKKRQRLLEKLIRSKKLVEMAKNRKPPPTPPPRRPITPRETCVDLWGKKALEELAKLEEPPKPTVLELSFSASDKHDGESTDITKEPKPLCGFDMPDFKFNPDRVDLDKLRETVAKAIDLDGHGGCEFRNPILDEATIEQLRAQVSVEISKRKHDAELNEKYHDQLVRLGDKASQLINLAAECQPKFDDLTNDTLVGLRDKLIASKDFAQLCGSPFDKPDGSIEDVEEPVNNIDSYKEEEVRSNSMVSKEQDDIDDESNSNYKVCSSDKSITSDDE